MKIAALSARKLASGLRRGTALRIGPFIVRLESPLACVTEGIALLYANYGIEDEGFADFHVRLLPPQGPRRWLRRQVLFHLDETVPFKPLPASHAFALFEWGLNWCVARHVHQYLVIHAAVVEKDGRAAIFPGGPGCGKSTLSAALVARGWRLLSDELALLSPDDGLVTPIPRPLALKNESIDVVRRFAPQAVIGRPCEDTQKGTVAHMRAPPESVERAGESARPAWLIFPRFAAKRGAELQQLAKGRALMRLAECCFNYHLLGPAGFHALGNAVDRSRCYELSFGSLEELVSAMDALNTRGAPATAVA